MKQDDILSAWYSGSNVVGPAAETLAMYRVANAAIAHACETGQVVPIEVHSERMKSQNAPFIEALASAAKRERELGEALHKATMALAEQPKGVESSLLDGMVERCLPAVKDSLFYGLRFADMSRDQLLAVAFKGWQLLQESRTSLDLVAFPNE